MVRLWDVRAQYGPHQPVHELKGHTDTVYSVCFSPSDEHVLASASDDKSVRVWDLRTGHTLHSLGHGGAVWKAIFHPKGHVLISSSEDKTIRTWSVTSGQQLSQCKLDHASSARPAARQQWQCPTPADQHFVLGPYYRRG